MELKKGKIFVEAEPVEVVDFLSSRRLKTFEIQPDRLHIGNDGLRLYLQFGNGRIHQYPLRESFLAKLLKWYSFPVNQLSRLNIDTVTSILNDFLLAISSPTVRLKVEDDEALTITSNKYSEITDLDVMSLCEGIGIRRVTRDDFFTRLYSSERLTADPVPGDSCGFGYNVLNSETGFRSLSIRHYIQRYICSNGAVVQIAESDQRVHFGYTPAEMFEFFSSRLLQGEASRGELISRMRASSEDNASASLKMTKDRLRAIIGWRQTEALLEQVPASATRYDLANIITDSAKQFEHGKRLQLEAVGGMLLAGNPPTTQSKDHTSTINNNL